MARQYGVRMNTYFNPAEYRRTPEAERQCVREDLDNIQIPPNRNCFALKVRGDAMAGRHILDGDIVFIDPMGTPSSGRVVAALVDGEEVLRTYLVEAGKPWLRAENPAYPRRTPCRELVVQGVAVGLLRFAEPAPVV